MLTDTQEYLFSLLRIALGNTPMVSLPDSIDWKEMIDLSFDQGVAAILVDGLQKTEVNSLMESEELEDLRYELFGETLTCEDDYRKRSDATKRLVALWAPEGISTVILKGSAISQYYPAPHHRYSCDLDLFIGEDWKRGCSILERNGLDINYEVYKDAQFHIDGIFVECHRFITPIRGNKTLQRFECYLRSLLKNNDVKDIEPMMPPLMFNALFCIEHARGHLFHEGLSLKQVCDWMMIRRRPVDWEEFWKRCDEFGFSRFAKMFDRLADLVEGKVQYEDLSSVARRVVDEMFSPASGRKPAKSFFARRVRQFVGTLRNGWKFRAFNDVSMPVALCRQVWTHFFDKEVEM